MNNTLSRIVTAVALATLSSAAWASTVNPIPVPEADSLGLLAAGVAAGVAALRLRGRK